MEHTLLTWHWPGLAELPGTGALALLVIAVFVSAEVAARAGLVDVEATRKFVHVGGGVLTLLVPTVLTSMWSALALALGGAAVLWWSARRHWLRSVHGVGRASSGALLFPLAMALCLIVSRGAPARFEIPLLAVTLADAAAALVGQRRGTHLLPLCSSRTVEGSATFVVVTAVVSLLALWSFLPPVAALCGAVWLGVVLAVVELCSPNGWDNVTIVVVGLLAVEWLLRVPPEVVCAAGVGAVACLIAIAHVFIVASPRRST